MDRSRLSQSGQDKASQKHFYILSRISAFYCLVVACLILASGRRTRLRITEFIRITFLSTIDAICELACVISWPNVMQRLGSFRSPTMALDNLTASLLSQ